MKFVHTMVLAIVITSMLLLMTGFLHQRKAYLATQRLDANGNTVNHK